jgi:hypothetical protein
MEQMLETVDLDVEEPNELLFKVKVEGIDQAPASVRLVCESGGDMSFMFEGKATGQDDIVQFQLPILKDKLKEGTYLSKVEVLVENRYFAPVIFNINFKKAVRVVAEAVRVVPRPPVPQVKVTASPITVVKKAPQAAPPAPLASEPKTLREVSLKERYKAKNQTIDEVNPNNEDLLRELARAFVRKK